MIDNSIYLIALAGKAYSGKNTVAQAILQELGFDHNSPAVVPLSFAAPMRAGLITMLGPLGLTDAHLTVPSLKQEAVFDTQDGDAVTPRALMQGVGAWGRSITPDLWVAVLEARMRHYLTRSETRVIIVDDVRMPNEADMLRYYGFHIVHVTAPEADRAQRAGGSLPVGPTEQLLSDDTIDSVIHNPDDGDLEGEVRALLTRIIPIPRTQAAPVTPDDTTH
jgi:hypothetical protein